jgi:ribosomal protein S13
MQRNIKRLATFVVLSMPLLSQAGSADLVGTYRKMLSTEGAMTHELGRQNLSSAYGGKLDRNLSQLNRDLQKAADVSRNVRGPIRGMGTENGVEILTRVAFDAIDSIDELPQQARKNLRDTIGDGLDSLNGDLEEKANDVVDALDDSLGEDSTRALPRSDRHRDDPAGRRVWDKRHHARDYQKRKEMRASRKHSKRGKQYGRNTNGYSQEYDNSKSGKRDGSHPKTKAQRKAEVQEKHRGSYSPKLKGQKYDGEGNVISGAASGVGVSVHNAGSFDGDREELAMDAAKLLRTGSLGKDTRTADQIDKADFADSETWKPSKYTPAVS